jgi:hypothetical protein
MIILLKSSLQVLHIENESSINTTNVDPTNKQKKKRGIRRKLAYKWLNIRIDLKYLT